MILRIVDLPVPDGPMIPTASPRLLGGRAGGRASGRGSDATDRGEGVRSREESAERRWAEGLTES